MSETEPFYLPLGDTLVLEGAGSVVLTNEICVDVGGPSQTVSGQVWLTTRWLAFRPHLGMPHPQLVDLRRSAIVSAVVRRPKLLGLLPLGAARLEVAYQQRHKPTIFAFLLDDPDPWAAQLAVPVVLDARTPRELVRDALKGGERDRGRYTQALEALSFPRGFWHTESAEDRDEVMRSGLSDLEIDVPNGFLEGLDLEVEVETGPEDYETGPGTEDWGRREQIARLCRAVNALKAHETRHFYAFGEDLPGWPEVFEPLWLWLSEEERDGLVELAIVTPVKDTATPGA